MQISNNFTNQQTSFGIKFVPNDAFKKTVKYAEKSGRLHELDDALHKLSKVGEGDLLLINGIDKSGTVFSNFTLNARRSVSNPVRKTPEAAAVDGFLELAELGDKFKKLFGTNTKLKKINANQIIAKYCGKAQAK